MALASAASASSSTSSSTTPWSSTLGFRKRAKTRALKYRDYYVWAEEEPKNAEAGMAFPGVQERIWSYDEEAEAYYLHRFYHHQPDLNITSSAVREEIRKIMGFWLELGVRRRLLHNLAGENCAVTLDLSTYERSHLIDLLGNRQYRPIESAGHRLELEGYGYRWLRLSR